MIDIHAHILPGVDDGARDIEDTRELLYMAVDSGVKGIVATPHCNVPGFYENYFGQWYIDSFRKVQEVVQEENIPITVYTGMEVYATENLPKLLSEREVMTINQSRYMLMEFDFDEDPAFACNLLRRVKAMKVRPIIAHPERYSFVQDNPRIVYEWRKLGYQVQVNKASFQGRFGMKAQSIVFQLMNHHLITAIASDAHNPKQRTTYMEDIYKELEVDYSKKLLDVLFRENPHRICTNQPTLHLPLIPFEEGEIL